MKNEVECWCNKLSTRAVPSSHLELFRQIQILGVTIHPNMNESSLKTFRCTTSLPAVHIPSRHRPPFYQPTDLSD